MHRRFRRYSKHVSVTFISDRGINMRKLVIGTALATAVVASPAMAREGSWYLEGDFGGMIVEDSDFSTSSDGTVATIDSDKGFDGGAALGYDFGMFRLETEASYRKAKNDEIFDSSDTFSAQGDANVLSFMLNGLLDFGDDDGIQGFVGGGGGVGRVSYDVGLDFPSVPLHVDLLNATDTGFAWQVLAGLRLPLSGKWDAGLKYRFFNVDNVKVVDTEGEALKTKWRSHSLMGSIIYNFGAEPPPNSGDCHQR